MTDTTIMQSILKNTKDAYLLKDITSGHVENLSDDTVFYSTAKNMVKTVFYPNIINTKTAMYSSNSHIFMMGDTLFEIHPKMAFAFLELHSTTLKSLHNQDAVLAAYELFYTDQVNKVFEHPMDYLPMEILFDNPGKWPFGELLRTNNDLCKVATLELPTEDVKILFLIVPLRLSYNYYTATIIPCLTTNMEGDLVEYDITGSLYECGITSTDAYVIKHEIQQLKCNVIWNFKTKKLSPMIVPKTNYEKSINFFDKFTHNQFVKNNTLNLVGNLITLSERLDDNDTHIIENIVGVVERFLTRDNTLLKDNALLDLSKSAFSTYNKQSFNSHPEVQTFTQVCVLVVFLFSKITFEKKESNSHLVYPILEHLLSFERIREFILKDGEGAYYDLYSERVNGFSPYLIVDIITGNKVNAAKLHKSFNVYMAAIDKCLPNGSEIASNVKRSIRLWDNRQLPMEIAAISNPLNDYLFSVGRKNYRKFQGKIDHPTVLRYPMMKSKIFTLDGETADIVFDRNANYIQRLWYVTYHLDKSKAYDVPNCNESTSFMRSSYDLSINGFRFIDVSNLYNYGHMFSKLEIHNIENVQTNYFTKIIQGDVEPITTKIQKAECFINNISKGNLLHLLPSIMEASTIHLDNIDGLNVKIIFNPKIPITIDNTSQFDSNVTTLNFYDTTDFKVELLRNNTTEQTTVNQQGEFFNSILDTIGSLLNISDNGKDNYAHIVSKMIKRSNYTYNHRHVSYNSTASVVPVSIETFTMNNVPSDSKANTSPYYSGNIIHEFVLFLIDIKNIAKEKGLKLPDSYNGWNFYIACTTYNGKCNSLPLVPALIEVSLSHIIRLINDTDLAEIRTLMEMLDGQAI